MTKWILPVLVLPMLVSCGSSLRSEAVEGAGEGCEVAAAIRSTFDSAKNSLTREQVKTRSVVALVRGHTHKALSQ